MVVNVLGSGMAGLLLGTANVLVLMSQAITLMWKPLEALAEALSKYQGTVIFTSHDRHLMGQVATSG